jgi:uncharacterized RDD family membrane protein YckC
LEVNRRVAEHNERKGQTAATDGARTESHPVDSPAARVAERVAARYAKAPSYSELMAEEARAALRAAEAVSRAALEAQAAAASVLAGLEAAAAASDQQAWEPALFAEADLERKWAPSDEIVRADGTGVSGAGGAVRPSEPAQRQSFEVRYDADMPVRESGLRATRASRGVNIVEAHGETLRYEDRQVADAPDSQGFEVVEAAHDIPANLIQFPRELVATRKIRPRRAEGPYAALVAAQGQLSIFEVEQSAISTEPEAASIATEAGKHSWAEPGWSGIELDAEPEHEIYAPAEPHTRVERAEPSPAAVALKVAPLNLRLMAGIVDFSWIMAGFLTAVMVGAENASVLPSVRELELGSALALVVTSVLYQALFLTMSRATPGMKYAGIELCTLDGKWPSAGQRWMRAAASVLSLLPMGLGVLSAMFAEHSLCWHDRVSGTYLRKG